MKNIPLEQKGQRPFCGGKMGKTTQRGKKAGEKGPTRPSSRKKLNIVKMEAGKPVTPVDSNFLSIGKGGGCVPAVEGGKSPDMHHLDGRGFKRKKGRDGREGSSPYR